MVDENELLPWKVSTTYQPSDALTKVCTYKKLLDLSSFLFGGPLVLEPAVGIPTDQ